MATTCSNMVFMSSSLSTTACRVKWRVEVLHDQERVVRVGDVVVPALADRNALEQIVAAVQSLPQLQQIGFAR